MATATATRKKARGRRPKAEGKSRGSRVKSQGPDGDAGAAEISTGAGKVTLSALTNAAGRYRPEFCVTWQKPDDKLRDYHAIASTGRANSPTFAEERLALMRAATDAIDHLRRAQMDHLTKAQYDAIDDLIRPVHNQRARWNAADSAGDDATPEESNGRKKPPAKPKPKRTADKPLVEMSDEELEAKFGRGNGVALAEPVPLESTETGQTYHRPDRDEVVGVHTGLGGCWIVATLTPNGSKRRVKSPKLPPTDDREACQKNLDAYAAQKGWMAREAETPSSSGSKGAEQTPSPQPSPKGRGSKRLQPSASSLQPRPVTAVTSKPVRWSKPVEIPLEKIHRRPSNRGGEPVEFPDAADLMESIEAFGLSRPIEVRDSSDEQELPVGHYELLKGERRWTAFRALARDTIPAVIHKKLSDRDAEIQTRIDNTYAKTLDPIQRALAIQHGVDMGMSIAQASLANGVSESVGKHAVRLLKLSSKLQQGVRDGVLPERDARRLVSYAKLPACAKAFEKRLAECRRYKEPFFSRHAGQAKYQLERLTQPAMRFVDGKRENDYGWQKGKHRCYFAKAVRDDEALRKKLGVVELRIDNKPVQVATNVKLFDKLHDQELAKRKAAERERSQKKAAKNRAQGKAANPQVEKQQDDALARHAKKWRHRFLRLSIASHMLVGDSRAEKVALWVLVEACEDAGLGRRLNLDDWIRALGEEAGLSERQLYDHREGNWRVIDLLIRDENDPVTDGEMVRCHLARRVLWPQSPSQLDEKSAASDVLTDPQALPERFPELCHADVEKIAAWLATDHECAEKLPTTFAAAWDRARRPGPERQMVEQLLEFCNKRQLRAIAEELGVWTHVEHDKRLADQRARLLGLHNDRTKLQIPALVAGEKKRKGGRK